MKSLSRNALVVLSAFAAITVAGCADLEGAIGGGSTACTDSTHWFERQRLLVDGHADPHDAAIDAPCMDSTHQVARDSGK